MGYDAYPTVNQFYEFCYWIGKMYRRELVSYSKGKKWSKSEDLPAYAHI
jgi:hypothetical protein